MAVKRVRFQLMLTVLLAMVLFVACAEALGETVVGDVDARLNAGKMEYKGENYRFKKRITSVLVIGTDQMEGEMSFTDYRSGGQADFLVLLVIDDNAETVTPIQINRDTITDITLLSSFGQDMGTWKAQICLSHSFGDGKEESCGFTVKAVSNFLKNVPIDDYIAINMDGIITFNDALGGVPVTLEDDFTAFDPSMTAGTQLILQGQQAEYFVRMRHYVGEATNVSRLARQKVYMQSAVNVMKEKTWENSGFINELLSTMEPYITTDMNRGRIINLAELADRYEILPMVEIEGQTTTGANGYVEFYADEDALWRVVLDAFYEKMEG